MDEKKKKDFAESLGISESEEKKIKSLVEEALLKSETTKDAMLFLCRENKMEIKSVFAGFCAGIVSAFALIESGKIAVATAITIPIPMPVSILDDDDIYDDNIAG